MAPRTLDEWLQGIESLHPREIDLGLDRVREVLGRLGMSQPPFEVVTIGGTNGKGSVVEMVQHALGRSGIRVGAFTSPHLFRYNERMRVDGSPLPDEAILAAIREVEAARGTVPLTYFEYCTLAALAAFREHQVQVAVMEVGMGGRLDAVNVLDATVAAVTSVDLDHMDWLGSDRESIGTEKAGIFRKDTPAIVGDPAPPGSLLDCAARAGATLYRTGLDFGVRPDGEELAFWNRQGSKLRVPRTPLTGDLGGQNTAVALQVLQCLPPQLRPGPGQLYEAFGTARLLGRYHRMRDADKGLTWVLDVAHNGAAVANLVGRLKAEPGVRRWHIVVGMLRDKDARDSVSRLAGVVNRWYLAPLPGGRGQSSEQLAEKIAGQVDGPVLTCASIPEALDRAREELEPGEGVVVLGSFQLVGPAIEHLRLYCQSNEG